MCSMTSKGRFRGTIVRQQGEDPKQGRANQGFMARMLKRCTESCLTVHMNSSSRPGAFHEQANIHSLVWGGLRLPGHSNVLHSITLYLRSRYGYVVHGRLMCGKMIGQQYGLPWKPPSSCWNIRCRGCSAAFCLPLVPCLWQA